eukprot:TRINITY_DN5442_c0_g1_i1.p1 TRINITY_DN5442_c0_g1~~TRINITY_DN5442_c0_g1_i1.p1  ORF type:complete len:241 (-),score=78.59 TRINITY_DN5442_c0_g1_i1:81-803(-)
MEIIEVATKQEGTDTEYYSKAADYWENVTPTINGMLGGFAKISHTDIDGSNKFLKVLLKVENGPGTARALDCGAGIGRITKHLLTKHFDTVDLVEQDKHFLEKAKEYLAGNTKVGQLYCAGLQNFDFIPETYDVIWSQWVLGHLTEEHLKDFFVRCIKGLKLGGFLVVKENVTSNGEIEADDDDSSVTRPPELLREIFARANLEIFKEFKQNKFPKELYAVHMFALRAKKETDSSVAGVA